MPTVDPWFFCQCFAVERVKKGSFCCFLALATHFGLVLAGLLVESFIYLAEL